MEQQKFEKKYEKYKDEYTSEADLITKLTNFAKSAGLNTSYYILLLYYVLKAGVATFKEQVILYSSLGYFLCPFDIIPDFLLGTGLIDDATALLMAVSTLSGLITEPIKKLAKEHLAKFFDFKDEELNSSYR